MLRISLIASLLVTAPILGQSEDDRALLATLDAAVSTGVMPDVTPPERPSRARSSRE